MPVPMTLTPGKSCENCGSVFRRKRFRNGVLESVCHFRRRKYCNRKCFGEAERGQGKEEVGYTTAHYHARRLCPQGPCVKCGRPNASDVHHTDGDWRNN